MLDDTIEFQLILEAIYLKYGYDFRNYSKASIKRRIIHKLEMSRLPNLSALQHKIIHNYEFFKELLFDITIHVTEMFRDPSFYHTLRENVIPILKTYPHINIWHAGCSSGEEVYSMAILLKEEGLLDKSQLYATDINESVLNKAKEGIYPLDKIKEYTMNYQKSGGLESFAGYYTARYNAAIMNKSLKKHIVFSQHNLVTDGVFAEMNLIFCRNVLIYFNKHLQNRVIGLFHDSLVRKGFIGLGSKESIKFTDYHTHFKTINEKERLYQKV